MKGSNFNFDDVSVMHYIYNKTAINRDRSYIDSP